jgi:hypothetical protein
MSGFRRVCLVAILACTTLLLAEPEVARAAPIVCGPVCVFSCSDGETACAEMGCQAYYCTSFETHCPALTVGCSPA